MARPVITDKPILDQAEFNGVTIWRKEGGSIEVSDTNYPSMKAALLDIAQKAGINVEKGWNTQYLGWYIIQQLKKSGSAKAIMIEPVKVEVKKQAAEAPVIDVAPVKGERDGELIIELKEPGTLMSIIVNNGVDMAAIKCFTLKGVAPNQDDIKLIKTIAESYHTLETLDLSDVQMETVEGFSYSSFKAVILPKCAVSIGDWAFWGCKSLMQVTIPDSVTLIGHFAFNGCESLNRVTISDSVTSIGDSAFSGCTSLTQVTIPAGVTSIGRCAFGNCESLTQVTISVGVTTIGEEAFILCKSLKLVEINSKMPFELASDTFERCPDDLKIVVPKGTLPFFKMSWSYYSSRIVESEK